MNPYVKAFVAMSSVPLLFASCVTYPAFHNHYLHPIGRMSREIAVGSQCDGVRESFSDYVRESGSADTQFSEGRTTRDLYRTKVVPESKTVHLYDTNLFDDLQIEIRCSLETDKVVEVLAILD